MPLRYFLASICLPMLAIPMLAGGQTPSISGGRLPPDRIPFDAEMACNHPKLRTISPRALDVMSGTYRFASFDLGGGESEKSDDIASQFNYPLEITIPSSVGDRGRAFRMELDKDKLSMKNFLIFRVNIPDNPFALRSDDYCVSWGDTTGFYFRGTISWDGTVKPNGFMIITPGPPASNGMPTINMFCPPFVDCWGNNLPDMDGAAILGRGLPVGYWSARRPPEALAHAEKMYNRSRWQPTGGGGGNSTDGDGKDAFPFTTYDFEMVGGIDVQLKTRRGAVCQMGVCAPGSTPVFVAQKLLDGRMMRRFYNDARLGFPGHYPGGTEHHAFFTALRGDEKISGPVDPRCTALTMECFRRADRTDDFDDALKDLDKICGGRGPCGATWPRPTEPINAEVVIEGTDDAARLAAWCAANQGVECLNEKTNPLDGKDVLVSQDSLLRDAQAARNTPLATGYEAVDTAGMNAVLSGGRGAGAPAGPSETEVACRRQAAIDSITYINGPIPTSVDRRSLRFNGDSAYQACRARMRPR